MPTAPIDLDLVRATRPAAQGHTVKRVEPAAPEGVIVIGASTGGPQALSVVLEGLAPALRHAPVLVVLHIPAEFAAVVAEHMQKATGLPTRTARQGEPIEKGRIYLAPGSLHLSVVRIGNAVVCVLLDEPPRNFCKPSVDVLFQGAARCFGAKAVGLMLTGMGSDGLEGSRAIVRAGGKIIAQDAASSTVWGMPGAVVNDGLAHAVLPLGKIAPAACGLIESQLRVREKAR